MKIKYTKKCTTVYDCYEYTNKEIDKIGKEIVSKRKLKGYKVTRTAESYSNEIKAHKRAYKLGIMRNHSKDADLEENLSKKLEIVYKVFGI